MELSFFILTKEFSHVSAVLTDPCAVAAAAQRATIHPYSKQLACPTPPCPVSQSTKYHPLNWQTLGTDVVTMAPAGQAEGGAPTLRETSAGAAAGGPPGSAGFAERGACAAEIPAPPGSGGSDRCAGYVLGGDVL